MLTLSASMKTKSKGPASSDSSRGRVSSAAPTRRSTRSSEPGALDVVPGDLGVVGVELERGQPAVFGQGAGHDDRAVAAEGAELEDLAGVDQAAEDLQQARLRRGDLDLWQVRGGRVGEGRLENLVLAGEEGLPDQGINRVIGILVGASGHAEHPSTPRQLRPVPSPAIFLRRPRGPRFTLPSNSWGEWESCIRERNRSDEGSSFRQADVREVQGDPPKWRGSCDLSKPPP